VRATKKGKREKTDPLTREKRAVGQNAKEQTSKLVIIQGSRCVGWGFGTWAQKKNIKVLNQNPEPQPRKDKAAGKVPDHIDRKKKTVVRRKVAEPYRQVECKRSIGKKLAHQSVKH